MKALLKIDKFFPVFLIVLIGLAALVIFTFNTIFTSVGIAYEPEAVIPETELRINKEALLESQRIVADQVFVNLEIKW